MLFSHSFTLIHSLAQQSAVCVFSNISNNETIKWFQDFRVFFSPFCSRLPVRFRLQFWVSGSLCLLGQSQEKKESSREKKNHFHYYRKIFLLEAYQDVICVNQIKIIQEKYFPGISIYSHFLLIRTPFSIFFFNRNLPLD